MKHIILTLFIIFLSLPSVARGSGPNGIQPAETTTTSTTNVTPQVIQPRCMKKLPTNKGWTAQDFSTDEECYPTACDESRYKLEGIIPYTKCVDQVGKNCTPTKNGEKISNATDSTYEWKNGALNCPLKNCENGFALTPLKTACVEIGATCSDADRQTLINSTHNTTGAIEYIYNKKGECEISKCKDTHTLNTRKGICELKTDKCSPEDLSSAGYTNYTSAKYVNGVCTITECKQGYKIEKNSNGTTKNCILKTGECTKNDVSEENVNTDNANKFKYNDYGMCRPNGCQTGYTLENEACKVRTGDCDINDMNRTEISLYETGTLSFKYNNNGLCRPYECLQTYTLNTTTEKCELKANQCSDTDVAKITNAAAGQYDNGGKCIPTDCKPGFELDPADSPTKCIKITGNCTTQPANSATSHREYSTSESKTICKIDTCADGFLPTSDYMACQKNGDDCLIAPKNAKIAKYEINNSADNNQTLTCKIQECNSGYDLTNNVCVSITGDCNPMPDRAISAHREYITYSDGTQGEECIIDECRTGSYISPDRLSCDTKLSEADSQSQIDELRENAQNMKDKEQSTANKLIGAAGIGATGIGAMQAASAYSEQQADIDAERDMAAYLATFKCDYGAGLNISGGDTDIALPGGNSLIPLYGEYLELANDLKIRKSALNLPAGIESAEILDSATSGLYDNAAIGKTDGSFASISRALQDPTSAAAIAWNAQKEESAKKLKTGLITAGIGAAGSLTANLAVNSWGSKQDKTNEILNKYKSLKKLEETINNLPSAAETAQCPEGRTGTYPECICEKNQQYNENSNTCEEIEKEELVEIKCPDGGTETPPNCTCKDKSKTYDKESNTCKENAPQISATEVKLTKINFQADSLFDFGKSDLTPDANTAINKFATEFTKANSKISAGTEYCIFVVGHTDTSGSEASNQTLSEKRAKAVADALKNNSFATGHISASGKGETECKPNTGRGEPTCRTVTITVSAKSCPQ